MSVRVFIASHSIAACRCRDFARSGGTIHSVVSARAYVERRLFSVPHLPSDSRLKAFLRVALDVASSTEALFSTLARELAGQIHFVPRAVLHAGSLDISATLFHVLSVKSLQALRTEVGGRECTGCE